LRCGCVVHRLKRIVDVDGLNENQRTDLSDRSTSDPEAPLSGWYARGCGSVFGLDPFSYLLLGNAGKALVQQQCSTRSLLEEGISVSPDDPEALPRCAF